MGDSELQRKLITQLLNSPDPEIDDDVEIPFDLPEFADMETIIEEGADPQFARYSSVQQQVMAMSILLEQSGMADEYHAAVEAGIEKYSPAFPPMSPVTDSYFYAWALYDLKFGLDNDNAGQLIARMLIEMGAEAELESVLRSLLDSRMGVYETLDASGERLVVRELVTDRRLIVDVPTGFLGSEGMLRFVRLVPPLHSAEHHTELTTPYILTDQSTADWSDYLRRVMPDSVVLADGAISTDVEHRLAAVFKEDLGAMPWLDFIFDGYHHYVPEAIFLSGIPDQPESLPQGQGTAATNLSMNLGGELIRKAKSLGITIIPPDTPEDSNASKRLSSARGNSPAKQPVQPGEIEIALTDAQRKAAAELLPDFSARFRPDSKGKKRVRLSGEDWNRLSNLVYVELTREIGRRRTPLRNLRDAIGSVLAHWEPSSEPTPSSEVQSRSVKIYRMRIEMTGSEPLIWRQIEVPDCSFAQLHFVVQAAMGWTNSHLHEFIVGRDRYSIRRPFAYNGDGSTDSTGVMLSDVIPRKGKKLRYVYDFGDNWEHAIQVQSIQKSEASVVYPRCLAGQATCPPEDCGGIRGYNELLEILSDQKHPEYEDRIEWSGPIDPNDFDVTLATQQMQSWYHDEAYAFDINEEFFGDEDLDEDAFQAWSEHLQDQFAQSPEFAEIANEQSEFFDCFLHFGASYLGVTPAEMSVPDLNELLFDIIPRKVIMDPEEAGPIIVELRAFFEFLHREYSLPNAKRLASTLNDKMANRFAKELSNESNFGMAKSLATMGTASGFDMTNPEDLGRFMAAYNSQLPSITQADPDPVESATQQMPTLTRSSRPGRNDPCHCGSGRKYKKCCLSTDGQ